MDNIIEKFNSFEINSKKKCISCQKNYVIDYENIVILCIF